MIIGIGAGVGFNKSTGGSVPPLNPIYQSINGYKYLVEQEAIDAVALCAANGIMTSYQATQYDVPTFWYIEYMPGMELFMGPQQNFNIIVGYA